MNTQNTHEDHRKRTDISQLLNPASSSSHRDHTAYPDPQIPLAQSVRSAQLQHGQQEGQPYQPSPGSSNAMFPLRVASWGEDAEKQNVDPATVAAVAQSARPYPYSSFPSAPVEYNEMASRISRPRSDTGPYPMDNSMWPGPEVPNPYGPGIAPMYSDERTAMSGDFNSNNGYSQPYPDQTQPQQPNPSESTDWQSQERASVRLAARTTMPEQMVSQPPRYTPVPAFYPALQYTVYHHTSQPMIQQQQLQQSQPPKRAATAEEEDSVSGRAKRTKGKAKSAEGSSNAVSTNSKRGYNAKKRSEAAQIAAQNAALQPVVQYTQAPTEKGKEKASDAPMRIVSDDTVLPSTDNSGPLHPELQFARCMSNRYRSEQFPRCVSCTRRWAGDTCRFQGIRFFLKNAQRNIVGISFVESQKPDAPTMNFPTKWNVPLKPQHIRRIKRTIARALLPTLKEELNHLNMPEIIRRPRESEVRATCDTCMTSIFSSSWMCRLCGREACAECFEQVKELTENPPGASQQEIAALQARREKHAHSNPFFLSCTRRNEHQSKDFSPMSRFCKPELAQAIEDMEKLLVERDDDHLPEQPTTGVIDPVLQQHSASDQQDQSWDVRNASVSGIAFQNGPEHPEDVLGAVSGQALTAAPPASAELPPDGEIPSHPTKYFADGQLTEEVFRPIWAKGEPIVVTGLHHKFRIQWTPDYFIEKYETQPCLILECQTEVNRRVTVGEFFSMFGKYSNRKEVWKLKDWPPSTDFRVAFPELYEDFCQAVPVPNYVRRDGALNIASHFPSNTVAPDLGPKMYNAMASSVSAGSKGSTRLHMDMADAVNVMTYAAPFPDSEPTPPGSAAWDLFRAEDSDKIRTFLKKRFKGSYQNDPIHAQLFYLDEELRKELWLEHSVKSHRVYQNPGEAVFIPAGCAHQVCNLTDCVKVAVDFVSPENIDRCEKLTREFREQNQSMVWKEDVLQLRTMMWFAWLSCCRQES